ncbi:mycofactocin-coupled SDR family oxidoreductase [Microbacterium kribbense]|uniref:Mycofactocin-coupled SDR family oxidoreductase n=1 Tax=Microbacterium kribbense TaxID=433645 RepID=A0ABP7G6B9_9MICO
MAGKLEGKVAFITGIARGQGRSHAVRLAQEGADIIGVDICRQVETVPYATATPEDLAETVRQVESLDRRIIATEVDIRDGAALKQAADDGVAQLGRLDIVLANAGISTMHSTVDMPDEVWDTMIDINLSGQFKTIRATVPHIIAGDRGGAVVITSSLAAMKANANIAHYTAAKSGQVLALELAPHRIRVNTVHPTTVNTDMVLNEPTYKLFRPDLEHPTREDYEVAARTLNKLPTAGLDPVDISNAILYLVSDDGRFVTGTTHVVSAGGQL